jgi:hypothetical protein
MKALGREALRNRRTVQPPTRINTKGFYTETAMARSIEAYGLPDKCYRYQLHVCANKIYPEILERSPMWARGRSCLWVQSACQSYLPRSNSAKLPHTMFQDNADEHDINLTSELSLSSILSRDAIILAQPRKVSFLSFLFQEPVQHGRTSM